jgi:hypothetical protein
MKPEELKQIDDRELAKLLAGTEATVTTVKERKEQEPDSVGARLCDGGGTCITMAGIS